MAEELPRGQYVGSLGLGLLDLDLLSSLEIAVKVKGGTGEMAETVRAEELTTMPYNSRMLEAPSNSYRMAQPPQLLEVVTSESLESHAVDAVDVKAEGGNLNGLPRSQV
jgi:hypothetical protein